MVLIFLHVPKAGGTSMIEILQQQYGDVQVITDETEQLLKKGQYQHKVIHGHIPYGVHIKDECQYLTILRHPVSRITSLYYYIMSLAGKGWWEQHGVRPSTTLAEFIELPMCHVDNSMTRQMSGQAFRHQKNNKKMTKADYNQSVRNLKKFVAVGRLEEFDKTIEEFSKVLAWKNVTSVQLNKIDHPEPDQVIQERIEERNKWDLKLWQQFPL